ncbi:hypothetical protein [uncultured Tateyamaria sp.]|uniref:hypothetical protein n=1 Tax=uncultured Tateyamaria sp. TaxID=455651 RepID=UPI0026362DF1|nr:hypothetical protein [uncultured Tateyamaria sp.]
MPTRIATLGRERRIATLARRVFDIEGRPRGEAQRRAEMALLRANPQLATEAGFRPGASIVVPTVVGLRPTEAVSMARADARGLTEEARLRLQTGSAVITSRFALSEQRSKALRAQLSSRAFRQEVKEALPEALPLAEAANARLEEEQATNRERSAAFQAGIEQALDAVQALQDLVEQEQNS